MGGIVKNSLCADPIEQFILWQNDSFNVDGHKLSAMGLATSDHRGKPSVRMVLLKSVDSRGFIFYTNYNSEKSRNIECNGYVEAMFYWEALDRQVRIRGNASKISSKESDQYFRTRPRGSQISAIISDQSSVVKSRSELEDRYNTVLHQRKNNPLDRPVYWGGILIQPYRLEFWQGRTDRLHDRFVYKKTGDGAWEIVRLEP